MWLQPNTLDEFLQLKWEHPNARVVVGNTEVGQSFFHMYADQHSTNHFVVALLICLLSGIEVKFKNMVYPVILAPNNIPELNMVTQTEGGKCR